VKEKALAELLEVKLQNVSRKTTAGSFSFEEMQKTGEYLETSRHGSIP
jgi:hypothetical protein